MTIHYTFTSEDDLLLVKASGANEALDDVKQYGLAVIEAARIGHHTRVLCDETELVYGLNTIETFQSAEFMASQAPRLARVAILCDPKFTEDARFWETVAVNRGLTVRFFRDRDMARHWLNEQPPT